MDDRAALRTLGNAVRHRKYVLLAIIAACTLGAAVVSLVRPPTYQGTALMFVDERYNSSQGFDLALQAGELLSAHFIQAATSRPVLDRACSGAYFTGDSAGVTCTATSLGPRVSASTVRGTDWIGVTVSASSRTDASALANAVAGAMLDQNKADIDQLLAPTRDYLNSELKQLTTAIADEEATIDRLQRQASPGQPAAIAGEQAQLSLLQGQYASTYAQSQNLVIEQNRLSGSLTLVQAATPPAKPSDPDPLRYIAVGLAAGLCLGLAAVVVLDRFDDRLFESDAFSRAASTRLVVAVSQKQSGLARTSELYGVARAHLLAQHPHMTKLLVVAASPRDRVRAVAAGLGMAAVNAGQKVLVIDAEAHTYVMQRQAGKNGSMMTIVSSPATHEGVVDDESLTDRDKYDLTIISAPSPEHDPTAVTMARTADVAVIVATARTTRAGEVRQTAETMRLAGIQIAAGILAVDTAGAEQRSERDNAPAELYEAAVNQWRLPTWRGPAGS